jgi:hypothetical protein
MGGPSKKPIRCASTCYPPIPRGNWRRSCFEAWNGEHNLHHDDDDDQYVHRWQPNKPPHLPPSWICYPQLLGITKEMVSRGTQVADMDYRETV